MYINSVVIIEESVSDKFVQSLNDYMHPAVVKGMSISELPVSTDLSETDLKILKYLVLGWTYLKL